MNEHYIVYKHTTPNGKVYIGVTCRDPKVRWANGGGYKNNPHFWSAIQKYGWNNIKHEILIEGLSKEEADLKEKELIAFYDSTNREKGYNNSLGGTIAPLHSDETKRKIGLTGIGRPAWNKGMTGENSHSYGVVFPEERKRKIGEKSKGRIHNESSREKNRVAHLGKHYRTEEGKKAQSDRLSIPVSQYTKDGVYVATYKNPQEAGKATGIAHQHIASCRSGKRKSAGGYIWRYADTQETG